MALQFVAPQPEEFEPRRWSFGDSSTTVICGICGTGLSVFMPADPAGELAALAEAMRRHEEVCPPRDA